MHEEGEMVLNFILAIVAVTASAGLFTFAIAWFAQSSMSEDATVRRRARFVEVLMSLAVVALYAATPEKANGRKMAVIVIGFVIIAWLFRGARLLLGGGKA